MKPSRFRALLELLLGVWFLLPSCSFGQSELPLPSHSRLGVIGQILDHIEDKKIILIGERHHSDTVTGNFHKALVEALIAQNEDIFILSEIAFYTSSFIVDADRSMDTTRASAEGEWLKHLARARKTPYSGLDCAISIRSDKDIIALAKQCGFFDALVSSPSWNAWLTQFKLLPTTKWTKSSIKEYLVACEKLHHHIDQIGNKVCDLEYIHRYIRSTSDNLYFDVNYWQRAIKQRRMTLSLNNYRDSTMASNAEYFIRTSKPETKFVILMSNYHIMRNVTSIESGIGEKKSRIKTTADWLFEKYGDQIYSIATINYKDMHERIHDLPAEKSGRSEASIEHELSRTCTETPCFIDISQDEGSWIMSPTFRKKNLKAPWGQIYDGLLFFKEL
ncbi:MAG: erythromycin esterase family protein [Flavobacteriales bacterium]|nr:erythromycin esterase family protein [Flavobacteriales bacterium]